MSLKTKLVYEFGEFRVDVEECRLLHAGEVLALRPKVVETLIALIEQNGRLVPKEALMDRLWPDSHVEEANLAVNVSQLRKALGLSASGESYIETVPKRGYKFSAPVKELHIEPEYLTVREISATHITIEEHTESGSPAIAEQPAIDNLAATTALANLPPLSTDSTVIEPAQPKRRFHTATVAAVGILLLAGLGYLGYLYLKPAQLIHTVFKNTTVEKLPIIGKIDSVALSPDGKYLAYIIGEFGKDGRLMLRQLETGSEKEILAVKDAQITLHSFSPDGNYFYFYHTAAGFGGSTLRQVALLGGEVKTIPLSDESFASFSPDGQKMVFVNTTKNPGTSQIVVADVDKKNESILHVSSDQYFLSPKFSPDGKKILFGYGNKTEITGRTAKLGWIPASGGEMTPLGDSTWNVIVYGIPSFFYHWLADGSGIMISNKLTSHDTSQIYLISFPDGKVAPVTQDTNGYEFLSTTANSRTLAVVKKTSVSGIWEFDLQTKGTRQIVISSTAQSGAQGLVAVDENKILFVKQEENGSQNFWQINADGSEEKLLVANKARVLLSAVSPDGRYIYFISNKQAGESAPVEGSNLWQMASDGSNLTPITKTSGENHELIGITPDNRHIFVRQWTTESSDGQVQKIDLESGQISTILDDKNITLRRMKLSPDGKKLLYGSGIKPNEEHLPTKITYRLVDIEGTKLGNTELILPDDAGLWRFHFAPDGKSIYYFDYGNSADIWQFDFTSKKSQKITNFNFDTIFTFTTSRDGKKLYLVRGSTTDEVVLIKTVE
jgi:Tol biopolymer transport system component/DNA-binding winged helix-turn-helix (wHTH) protein